MSASSWKRERFEEGPDLKLFKARFDFMNNPRNGKTEKMIILESVDSVNVIARTPEKEIIFVRQYRFGIGEETLELPGGLIDRGEEAEVAGKRELEEETAYTGTQWISLGKIASNPVFMDSYIHHYFADGVQADGQQQLDDGEMVEVVKIPEDEVYQLFLEGAFHHPHAINALLRYFVYTQKIK